MSAEGESLADLLDTYMKNCTKDKNIKPFGGGLFDNYTYAWAPQGMGTRRCGDRGMGVVGTTRGMGLESTYGVSGDQKVWG